MNSLINTLSKGENTVVARRSRVLSKNVSSVDFVLFFFFKLVFKRKMFRFFSGKNDETKN
jgi:hypothetical protein